MRMYKSTEARDQAERAWERREEEERLGAE